MQTLAVVCSLLRNFASVVVGVTREEDEKYIADMVSEGVMNKYPVDDDFNQGTVIIGSWWELMQSL
jgi:hypothetical protein